MPKKKAAKRPKKVTSKAPARPKRVAKPVKKKAVAAKARPTVGKKSKSKVKAKSKASPAKQKPKLVPPLHRPLDLLGSSAPMAVDAGQQASLAAHAKIADLALADRGGPAEFQKASHTKARHR